MSLTDPPPAKKVCSDESNEPMRVLVTGGSGLVGRALQAVIKEQPEANEEWTFLSQRDGDLR